MLFTISLIEYVIKTDKLTLTLKLLFFLFCREEEEVDKINSGYINDFVFKFNSQTEIFKTTVL